MKLITLARNLDFTNEIQYFDYCMDSYFNGNFSQCKNLFNAMAKQDRKRLMDYIDGCYDYAQSTEVYKFYLDLL